MQRRVLETLLPRMYNSDTAFLSDADISSSQPIYVAACAFLAESAMHTASSNSQSRNTTPTNIANTSNGKHESTHSAGPSSVPHNDSPLTAQSGPGKPAFDQRASSKHTLLATAANQNYQRCYKALQSLESYWAGTKYILTVLDQKAKGVGDPLLYTVEESESALEVPSPEPAFKAPGWRRKVAWGTYLTSPWFGVGLPARRSSKHSEWSQANGFSGRPGMNASQGKSKAAEGLALYSREVMQSN